MTQLNNTVFDHGVWEERWHPLREEWVIIAAHRQNRPWIGEIVQRAEKLAPRYVEDCYLCPGNTRVSGAVNPHYNGVYVFDNDHPCVGWDAPTELKPAPGVYRNRPAQGIARVVCTVRFTPPTSSSRLSRMRRGSANDISMSMGARFFRRSSNPNK